MSLVNKGIIEILHYVPSVVLSLDTALSKDFNDIFKVYLSFFFHLSVVLCIVPVSGKPEGGKNDSKIALLYSWFQKMSLG